MDVKPCPYCGKQLPSELSFCPYCMHSLAEKRTSPVQRTFAPPLFRYGLGAVLVLCALLSAVWLFPRRKGWVQMTFDRCVKIVHITVQNTPIHTVSPFVSLILEKGY